MREVKEQTRSTGVEAPRVYGVVADFAKKLGGKIGAAALAVVAACSPDTQAGHDGDAGNLQATELRTVEKALEMSDITSEFTMVGRIPGSGGVFRGLELNFDGTSTVYSSPGNVNFNSDGIGAPVEVPRIIEYNGENINYERYFSAEVDGSLVEIYSVGEFYLIDFNDGVGLRPLSAIDSVGAYPIVVGDSLYSIVNYSGPGIYRTPLQEVRDNALPGGEAYVVTEVLDVMGGYVLPHISPPNDGYRLFPLGDFGDGRVSFALLYEEETAFGLNLNGEVDLLVYNPLDGGIEQVYWDSLWNHYNAGESMLTFSELSNVLVEQGPGEFRSVPAVGISTLSGKYGYISFEVTSTGGDDVGVDTSDAGADVEDTTDTTDTSDTADAGADAVDTTDTSDTADTEADTTDTTDTADTEADATDTTDTPDTEADATDTTDTPDTEADATDTTDTIDTSIEHAPPAPVDLQVEEIGSNYATIGWQMPDVEYNYHVSGFVVMIAEEPDSPFKSANPAPLIDMNAMTATIPGLSPDTQYRVQVKPFCLVNGSMIEGDAVETTFETLEVEVEPDVTEDTSDTGADAGDTTDTTDAGADTDADTDAGNEGDSAASDVLGDSNLDTGQVVEHKEGREAGGCSAVQAETNQAVNLVLGVLALGAAGRRRRR